MKSINSLVKFNLYTVLDTSVSLNRPQLLFLKSYIFLVKIYLEYSSIIIELLHLLYYNNILQVTYSSLFFIKSDIVTNSIKSIKQIRVFVEDSTFKTYRLNNIKHTSLHLVRKTRRSRIGENFQRFFYTTLSEFVLESIAGFKDLCRFMPIA